jgi:mono/diheme cytochrome c family protein
MKLILAGLLLVLLVVAIVLGFRAENWSRNIVIIYVVCLVVVIGIGYFGGELVYGKRAPKAATEETLVSEGALVFNQSCSACHHSDKKDYKIGPGMQGLFQLEKLPVSGRPVTEANIRAQLKAPFKNMPAFPELSEEKVEALITFLKTL